MKTKVLILDHNDSFTWNLVQAVDDTGIAEAQVMASQTASMNEVSRFSHIILSPGPGLPKDFPFLQMFLRIPLPGCSILGVCLGHQAIAEAYGAQLYNLSQVRHGTQLSIYPTANLPLFKGLEAGFTAGLYHSWAVADDPWPEELELTARDKYGYVMAIRHKKYDIQGVQFHPESFMTPMGISLLSNWITSR